MPTITECLMNKFTDNRNSSTKLQYSYIILAGVPGRRNRTTTGTVPSIGLARATATAPTMWLRIVGCLPQVFTGSYRCGRCVGRRNDYRGICDHDGLDPSLSSFCILGIRGRRRRRRWRLRRRRWHIRNVPRHTVSSWVRFTHAIIFVKISVNH